MTPLTRKENYLNEIVGWGETAPEKPLTPEEFFFAAILGEAVQTPEPLSRYQIYLAKIAGRNISVPKPLTRLELFLAKACGMDIETPTPITIEEIFWSNYTAIVDFEVEGVPPLTYKAIEGTLENYRIYGNTVGGESVGDLVESGEHAGEYEVSVTVSNGTDTLTTPIYLPEPIKMVGNEAEYIDYAEQKQHRVRKNLFDEKYEGIDDEYDLNIAVIYKSINVGAGVFTLSTNTPKTSEDYCNILFAPGIVDSGVISSINGVSVGNPKTFTSINGYITIGYRNYNGVNPKLYRTQLERGNTATGYEPYIENTDLDVTLPALPTLTGTNVLSVGTAVQPSKVYVKYKGERQ